MLVVDLHCAHDHAFEGWFASADALADQQARGLVTCPVCGSHEVVRRPSASRLNVSGAKAPAQADAAPEATATALPVSTASPSGKVPPDAKALEAAQAMQAVYLQMVRHVVQNTEDVGVHFAEQARRMHHGEEPERAIRGQASAQEKAALKEEGIEVLSLPMPKGLDGPLQ